MHRGQQLTFSHSCMPISTTNNERNSSSVCGFRKKTGEFVLALPTFIKWSARLLMVLFFSQDILLLHAWPSCMVSIWCPSTCHAVHALFSEPAAILTRESTHSGSDRVWVCVSPGEWYFGEFESEFASECGASRTRFQLAPIFSSLFIFISPGRKLVISFSYCNAARCGQPFLQL